MRSISLNTQILIGAFSGIIIGLGLNYSGTTSPLSDTIIYIADIIGTTFISMLKMVVIPIIITSLSLGICNLKKHAQVNMIWKLSLLYFFITTSLAIITGLIIVNIFKPGVGLIPTFPIGDGAHLNVESMTIPEFFYNFFTTLFVNPIEAMAEGKIIPTVVFSIIVGIALLVAKDKGNTVHSLLSETFKLMMIIIDWIIRLSPIGVMGLLTKLTAHQSLSIVNQLGMFIFVVLLGLSIHGLITLPILLRVFTPQKIWSYFQGMGEALLTAFSTSSSTATLPVSLKCVKEKLKVDDGVAEFVLPLGATINMDGTALYEAVAAIFVANITGYELNIVQQLIIFLMSMVASVGAPGIPSAGMVTMIMVLQSVGLPIEAIGMLLPIDRLLDTIRTTVNVEGDTIGSCIINHICNKKR